MTIEHIIDVEHLGHDHILRGSANSGSPQAGSMLLMRSSRWSEARPQARLTNEERRNGLVSAASQGIRPGTDRSVPFLSARLGNTQDIQGHSHHAFWV